MKINYQNFHGCFSLSKKKIGDARVSETQLSVHYKMFAKIWDCMEQRAKNSMPGTFEKHSERVPDEGGGVERF